ncbi:MAG: FkbM family methyltransferase [Gammaproteobacteria bacterium]|nr:FkbM family methyltransferase [Gammaproteobacteria bacterium]
MKPARRLPGRVADAVVPARLLKYSIAWRNWRRGEAEIHLLGTLVDGRRDAVDVGAYRGAYTFFLARLARAVHAFEPQPDCARFLRRAYGRRVQVHECALADTTGSARLELRGGPQSQAARLGAPAAAGIDVTLERLDDFGLDDVGFMKIDAEGAEERILRGARGTLARSRPVLLVEIEQRHLDKPIQSVFEYIQDLGYHGWFLLAGELHDLAQFSVDSLQAARLRGDRSRPYVNNFIFRPQ